LLPFDQARDLPFVGARLAGDGVIEGVIASKPGSYGSDFHTLLLRIWQRSCAGGLLFPFE
jgi:hypothetical protein